MRNEAPACPQLARATHGMSIDRLPASVVERAKMCTLDYVSALCAGTKYGEMSAAISRYVQAAGGAEQASVIGQAKKIPAGMAALANGAIAHSVELDDGHRFGTSHPAVAVIPAALAAAEQLHSSGGELLAAVAAGYEAMLRIASAINPGHWRRGFHSTGTCGAIGAAAAVAKLMKLTEEQTAYAISMGALQGAGLQVMLGSHAMIKPIQPGRASEAGIICGALAQAGIKSPLDVFEGNLGYFQAMTDQLRPECLERRENDPYEIERTYFKFYPTCRHVHCSLDLLREILTKRPVKPADIKSILVRTYTIAVKEVAAKEYPKNSDEAMFHIPYALAVWLHEGKLRHAEFAAANLVREDFKETAGKVEVRIDPHWDELYPESRGATLMVELNDGTRLEESCNLPYGEPERFDGWQRLIEKYRECVADVFCDDAEQVVEGVRSLEEKPNLEFLSKAIRQAHVSWNT